MDKYEFEVNIEIWYSMTSMIHICFIFLSLSIAIDYHSYTDGPWTSNCRLLLLVTLWNF